MLRCFVLVLLCYGAIGADEIFFVHTSMETIPGIMESCAIESASRRNPRKQIVVYSNGYQDKTFKMFGSNIEVRPLAFADEFMKASRELSRWYTLGTYRNGFCLNNLSDAVRLALLYNYGGTYYDMDIISIRNVERAGVNSIGKESEKNFCNAALLNWSRHHPLLQRGMEDLVLNFNTEEWGNPGPKLFDRIMEESAYDTTVLEPHVLYSVSWKHLADFFSSRESKVGKNLLYRLESNEEIVGLHLWASLIRRQIQLELAREYRSDVVLWDVLEKYCPRACDSLPPRRPKEEGKQFSLHIANPAPGLQYYNVKSIQSVITIHSALESVDEKGTCVCVETISDSETNINFCVPWMSLQLISNEDTTFLADYTPEHFSRHDIDTHWRVLSFSWTSNDQKTFDMGFYALGARVKRCENALDFNLSEEKFTTWTSNWLQYYRPLQEKKCEIHYDDGGEL